MSRRGRKKPKRTRPVHDRQQRKRLVKDVQQLYGSEVEAEEGEAVWEPWHDDRTNPSRPRGGEPSSTRGASSQRGSSSQAEPAPEPTVPATEDGTVREGRVVALGSGLCTIEPGEEADPSGAAAPIPPELVEAVLPSRLAAEQQHRLAVGDRVAFVPTEEGYRVREVLPRASELARPDPHNPRRQRVIAANIDIVVVVLALVEPPLRPALVDRYRIAIERGGAEPLLVINKVDQEPDPKVRRRRLAVLDPFRQSGLRILTCSAKEGLGLDALRTALAGKIAAFVGHSGVGKSSLVNALDPSLELHTAAIGAAGSGRHTTTRSALYHLPGDIHLIDTPGVREFGLWRLEPGELRAYFPELDAPSADCRFNDCSHTHEPNCGVRSAVEQGTLRADRYATYRRILASLDDGDTP